MDRISGIWGSYSSSDIPKAVLYPLKGDYTLKVFGVWGLKFRVSQCGWDEVLLEKVVLYMFYMFTLVL